MITQETFVNFAMNDDKFKKAQAILKERYQTEFTMFSCNREVIELVNKDDPEIVGHIKNANRTRIDINILMFNKEQQRTAETEVERFFADFDNVENKERLFILLGETGVGKSYLIEQRYPDIVQYPCNKGLDSYTICYHLDKEDGSKDMSPLETPFLKAIKNGGKVFLDEMNELPHDTLMLLQGLTDEKKTTVIGDKVVEIHKDFKIIAAMNPPSQTDERTPLGDALLGRAVGLVVELTDEIIKKRLGCSQSFLDNIRELYSFMSLSFNDVRELNYRDYQKFVKYDFETQLKFKLAVNDIENIENYRRVSSSGEYKDIVMKIRMEMSKWK